jgi:methyl-accepting chemotaxis protein
VLGLFLFTSFWQVAMEDLTWRTGSMLPVAVYGKVRSTFVTSTVAIGSVITLLSAALSVWITHRVAGPIHGMNRTLARWLKGDRKARIKLRQNDEFQDFADGLNRLADHFEIERESADKTISDAIVALRGRPEPWADPLAQRLETALSSGPANL